MRLKNLYVQKKPSNVGFLNVRFVVNGATSPQIPIIM